jgi:hypothetical protein
VRLQRGDDLVPKATLKSVMKRLDPTFDEARFGFDSFTSFIDAFPDDIEHLRNDSGGLVRERVGARPRTGEFVGLRAALQSQVPRSLTPSDGALSPLSSPGSGALSPASGALLPGPGGALSSSAGALSSSAGTLTPSSGLLTPSSVRYATDPSGLTPPSGGELINPRGIELLSKVRTGQAYEQILKRANVLPLPAQWRQRALSHLWQIFDDAPEHRLASMDHAGVTLAKQLEGAGLDANPSMIERLKGNLLSLRMIKFHGPNGVGLQPRTDEGRLGRAVEEEMTLRIVGQAALPIDLVGFTEVLFGTVTPRSLNEAEALLKEVAPEAPLTTELGSLIEHLGDPAADAALELKLPADAPKTTVRALDLPGRLKVTPILLVKDGSKRVAPAPDEELGQGDVLVVMGKIEDVQRLEQEGASLLLGALPIPA